MRIAIVMPAGCRMDADRFNSMEAVATTLNLHSRFRSQIVVICDEGAETPVALDRLTVPSDLGKKAWLDTVAAHLRAVSPDLVEYHQQLGECAKLARRHPGATHLLYRHTRVRRPRHLFDRMRYQARLRSFDHLLFVSEAACAEFQSDYPGAGASISAVANPIDIDLWGGAPDQRERLILFAGRAIPEKGLDAFCEALAVTLDRHADWRGVLLLGEFERNESWAASQVRKLDRFGDRVEVRHSAPQADVVAATRRAAIAVTPSRVAEAFGLTALEAHAAGAALISSGRGGLREASGDHAVYVDPPEAPGLAAAMDRLIRDPAFRTRLAATGQEYVAETHNPGIRARQLDDLRVRLVAEKRERLPHAA